jgi:hypothetical protein
MVFWDVMPFSLVDGYHYFKWSLEMESACIYKTDHTVVPESEVEDCEQGVSVKS